MCYNAFDLAVYLYNTVTSDKIKIQKILYIAFGYYGALNNGKYLFNDEIQAWNYGPVIPSVYNNYIRLKRQPTQVLDPKVKRILDRVIAIYEPMKPFDLVALTHKKGSPWSLFYEIDMRNEIDKKTIIGHYKIILDASVVLLSSDSRQIMETFART